MRQTDAMSPISGHRYILATDNMHMNESNTASLIDELGTPLVRYLTKKLKNNEDANDLAQEAFLRMHRFQQSSQLDNARAFLFRTANNLVIDQIRRDKVHDKYLNSEMPPESSDGGEDKFAPSAERTVSAEQELDKIYQIVDKMPTKVSRAFLLHRGKDMSYSEIAAEMGVSNSMVEKYISEALKLLRKEMN